MPPPPAADQPPSAAGSGTTGAGPANGQRLCPAGNGAVAGLDPGRSKCGLVRTDPQRRRILEARVLTPPETLEALRRWQRQGLALVVLGDGTGHRTWQRQLEPWLPVALVAERGTTLEARDRYWRIEPAQGWRRLLPPGLRQPPRDWDDVVAQILVERWLGQALPRELAGPGGATLRSGPAP
jgi:hypothetical protein